MSAFVLVISAVGIGLYFAYLSFRRPPSSRPSREPSPVPASDIRLQVGNGGNEILLGYEKSSNTVSIWSPANDVIYVCATRFFGEVQPEVKKERINGFDKVINVNLHTPQTTYRTTALGDRVPSMEWDEPTGNSVFTFDATISTHTGLAPVKNDTRTLSRHEDAKGLVPPAQIFDNGRVTWHRTLVVEASHVASVKNFLSDLEIGKLGWLPGKTIQR